MPGFFVPMAGPTSAAAPPAVTMAIDTTASSDAGRLADLSAHHEISAKARHEIKLCIDWYLGVLNLGPDTAAAYGDATRLSAEARFIVAKAGKDVTAAIYAPPEFDPMHKAAVDLLDLVESVGVDRVVSIFVGVERIDAPDVFPDEQAQAIRDRLEQILADLNWLTGRITAVWKHARRPKRGPKTDREWQFVEMVAAAIERDKGQRIKRPSSVVLPSVVLPGSDKKGDGGLSPNVDHEHRARGR